MTLLELSRGYEEAAAPLRSRLRELRLALEQARDPEEIWHLKRRIGELTPMLTEMNELAELTARYYERGYWRSEKVYFLRATWAAASPGRCRWSGCAG